MGRSGGYCFKIIACGRNSESVDRDDLGASDELLQNKGYDKRGWSFRNKSAAQRVLSNTIITEISSPVNKSSGPVIITSETPITTVSEKASANQFTEELPRVSTSTTKSSTPSNLVIQAADEDEIKFDSSPDESSVIVIQTAVRKFLAQRELVRHERVVKLQAAVRGHLVRCRAAGTLRCIQAIIKMQTRVRAHLANKSVEKTSIGKEGVTKSHSTYISIEKLLSNRFAIQLLESTPRVKQINIKCNPTNEDTTYKWLEMWTSVSSPHIMESHTLNHQQEKTIDTKNQIGNTSFGQKPVFHSDESNHLNTGAEVGLGPTSFPGKHSLETELPKCSAKQAATEQADSEGRKSAFGSRKASNPTFIAGQSRFEELTFKNSSLCSVGSSNQEHMVKSSGESLVYESLKVGQSQTVDSECGTELSVTSMLDSPDPSEVENIESEKEAKVLDKEHALLTTELTQSTIVPSEKHDSNTDISQVKQSPEDGTELTQSTQIHHQVDKSSPEPSPRSHVTAHGTPSSEMSNNNKTKTDRKISGQKSKSWSKSTKSPVSSGLRTSLDHLTRETKPGRRRNSFGSQSSDQEPRDSSNNNIPSYMQVTESARAKALANNSPRSSPDVQVKEGYMKKRHSMPGAVNGRHDSPRRVNQTSPQAQPTTKGNNNNPERKWQN